MEFNLFELTFEQFQILYLCLAYENISADIPAKMKAESVSQEDLITKKLYKDYSVFKRELFHNLTTLNPDYEPIELFKKSQKLLDRLLFLFFGEDRGLLPPNSVRLILEQWNKLRDLDEYVPLYDRFKKYFSYLNVGFKGKQYDVFAYNGGLFKPDEVLDNIIIDDELMYKHSLKLADYDFASEVDVNILGHIFENSLNELDEVKAQLEGQELDKSKTKRKKDGVFYTPKYITKYIVENTVGKLCEDKKTEFAIVEEEYFTDKKRQQKTKLTLLQKLDDYRAWLHQITIIDPACGSGAFLNEALNFLIDEHQYIDELEAKLTGSSIAFTYHSESILENNLFGVDLNEESVEIAKLSLWLRTAEPNRKLNSLNNNIKCGNSLIDDPDVAGDKAFNWEQEFPQIFAKGGFDVVIGNPPYVRLQNIDEKSRIYFGEKYFSAFKNYDLYVLFTEKSKYLMKKNGVSSFIMPNKFITSEYGEKLQQFLFENKFLSEYIDFSDYQIFDDATTYTGVFTFSNNPKMTIKYYKINDEESKLLHNIKFAKVDYDNLKSNRWIFVDKSSSLLFHKLSELKRIKNSSTELFVGLQTSADPVFILEIRGDKLYSKFTNKLYDFAGSEIILKPLLKGSEIERYSTPKPVNKLIFPYLVNGESFLLITKEEMIKNHFNIWEYLNECKSKLEGRENGKMNNDKWYGYVYLKNMTLFDKPKILTQVLCKKSSLSLDLSSKNYFVGGGTAGGYGITISNDVNPHLLIAILNSALMEWYLKKIASPFKGGYFAYNKGTIGEIPLPNKVQNLNKFEEAVKKIEENNDKFLEISAKFQRTCERKFENLNQNKKLQDWYKLSYADFIKELTKQKIKLTLSEEAEWADYFDQEKSKALEIQSKIASTDKEIDQMVYELYGLSGEEIGIIEGN